MTKNICIAYMECGGGHLSAAQALKKHLEETRGWNVSLFNPYRELKYADLFKILIGHSCESAYNTFLLQKNRTALFLLFFYIVMKCNIFISTATMRKNLFHFLKNKTPDMMISVMPWVNHVFAESAYQVSPHIPVVTIATDFAECQKYQWFSSKHQFAICGTEKLTAQAKKRHPQPEKIFSIPGLIVSSAFYSENKAKKEDTLAQLGLDPHTPTGLVLYGSHGSKKVLTIMKKMNRADYPVQLIFVCGNNHKLVEAINNTATRYKKIALGFVNNIHALMQVSDFLIGKPGATTVMEALVSKLPMLLEYHIFTMPQERDNAKWVFTSRAGLPFARVASLPNKIKKLLSQGKEYKSALQQLGAMRGLFEIPGILDEIFLFKQNSQRRSLLPERFLRGEKVPDRAYASS